MTLTKQQQNEIIRKVIANRKAMKKTIQDDIIKPLSDVIKLGNDVILGKENVKTFIGRNMQVSAMIKEIFK